MKFNLLKNNKNTANLNSDINERTREKFILKGWIESNRKPTCTNKRTRGFLCRLHKLVLNGKMTFSCPTTCTDSYTRRENRCQIPFKTSLTRFKMDFSAGRSMVEMLGVLAIIGVLSIGGIQGYTMAMRKYKANEILSTLQKYAVSFYTSMHQKMLNDEVFIDEDGKWKMQAANQLLEDNNPNLKTPEIISAYTHGIKSTDSGDFVLMTLGISHKQLCQTIINITGETNPGNYGVEQCQESGDLLKVTDEYFFYISIPMN